MEIERSRALKAFSDYVAAYDATNPRIALKVEHAKRVADLCERIAKSEGLRQADVDLAWLIGLLHDIGRFEQVRRWDTFSDMRSTSHAALGAEVLFEQIAETPSFPSELPVAGQDSSTMLHAGLDPMKMRIRDFRESPVHDMVIRTAVATHSDYRLPSELDDRTRRFCNIVRDADKVDIVHAMTQNTCETILGVGVNELRQSALSSGVVRAFDEHHCVKRSDRVHPADYVVGFLCFAFELVYSESRKALVEQGDLFVIAEHPLGMDGAFANASTEAQFVRMRQDLRIWTQQNA